MNASTRPIALITGASSGIGLELAREFARDGYDLVLAARRIEPMQALADELKSAGASTTVIASDLSKPGAAAALAAELDARGLAIEALVNNSGLGDNAKFHVSDQTRIGEMLQVNMVALTELTRLLVPGMVKRGRGKVMMVASTASFQPCPNMAVYGATKAYVLSFGEAIGYELRGTGVSVTVLCPGGTTSGFQKVANTENIRFVKSKTSPRMTSAEVARLGFEATKAGRAVYITGLRNRVMAFSVRFSPRGMVLALANSMMEQVH